MPEHWLTDAERIRLTSFPKEIPEADVVTFFTLTEGQKPARWETEVREISRPVGRFAARGWVTQTRLGDSFSADRQTACHAETEHTGEVIAGIRAAHQNELHPPVSEQ